MDGRREALRWKSFVALLPPRSPDGKPAALFEPEQPEVYRQEAQSFPLVAGLPRENAREHKQVVARASGPALRQFGADKQEAPTA